MLRFGGIFLLAGLAFGQQAVGILEKRCAGCHAGASASAKLDLTSREALLRGGSRGPAVTPGKASSSLLFQAVSHTAAPHMPMGAPQLPPEEIAAIGAWIDSGANYQRKLASARPHWAFVPPVRPALPKPANAAWAANPIDSFIASARDRQKLAPVEEADKRTLLRRAYLDVTGVPPSTDEVQRFLNDKSPRAYDQAVDRLLADPRYGERWGRHFMDIWRYSDWYGYRNAKEVRNSQMFIWRWRDWIVESLNADKGYDQMVREMLAGDEIAPTDPKTLRATGFLARQYQRYDRDGWMQDAVDHTALGFLGVTVKCARCHDHKYDPFSQEDYYRLRAFFEPYDVRIDRVPGETDMGKDGLARVYDAEAERPTYLYVRGDIKNPDKSHALEPAVPASLGGGALKIQPVALPVQSYYPDFRGFVQDDLLQKAKSDLEKAEAELKKAQEPGTAPEKLRLAEATVAAAKAQIPALEARIKADRARYADPPDPKFEDLAAEARKLDRFAGILKGDEAVYRAMLDFVEARKKAKPGNVAEEKVVAEAAKHLAEAQAALTQVTEGYAPLGKMYPDHSSGRRLALANWIASRQNPLTARVAVNHIWVRHFGKPLVASVFDFGRNGKAATHPELLDWLASEFVESGWSMKRIHRLILTSKTYRMKSTAGTAQHPGLAADSENHYYWRMNPRRMEAEIVRDSILAVSGKLDPAMGGPDIDEAKGFEVFRRSIYFRHSPDTQMEFLKMFDMASPAECYERNESVVPQQALALANSKLSRDRSRELAAELTRQYPQPAAFARAAFERILGRAPSASEEAAALNAKPESLVHVLFNHNDFITIR